jgi:hypothetical protein
LVRTAYCSLDVLTDLFAVPHMRFSGPQPHPQYPGNVQHFGQPQMRGGPPGGNGFPQHMMGAPQGMMMPAGQMPLDTDQDGK